MPCSFLRVKNEIRLLHFIFSLHGAAEAPGLGFLVFLVPES